MVVIEYFKSAGGNGKIIFTKESSTKGYVDIVFDDGLKIRFEDYFKIGNKLEWKLLHRTIAKRELPEPEKAFYRLIMICPESKVWSFGTMGYWELGLWIIDEIPCCMRYWGLRRVRGSVNGDKGKIEFELLDDPRPDSYELALETFKRLYKLMTNPLEKTRIVGGEEDTIIF